VKRPAVYLAGSPEGVPPSLLHNLKHNHVLHQPLLLVTVETTEIPQVDEADRAQVTEWGQGVRQVRLAYGFSESPDVPLALANALRQDFDRNHVTYFLGKESLIPGRTPGMSLWRKRLYKFLAHNALDATTFYRLPAGQVVEIGGQTEL
jgi:KUP system potassium uptake protein